jgi:mono/diheme cytochrome c family protein
MAFAGLRPCEEGVPMKLRSLLILGPVALGLLTEPPQADAQEKWEAPLEAKNRANPLPVSAEVIARGRDLYRARGCSQCHGAEGDGSGAPALDPRPADLRSATVQAQTDGELFWKIYHGRGYMVPQFILPEHDLWAVVHFVRTLRK